VISTFNVGEGCDLRGRRTGEAGTSIEGRAGEKTGEPADFRYAVAAVVRRTRITTSKWQAAPFENTRFEFLPDGLKGVGRLYRDFRVEFEGRSGGPGSKTTGWRRQVEDLDGSGEIRARVIFDKDVDPDGPVAIRSLSIRSTRR
jgi:hypothetical protein